MNSLAMTYAALMVLLQGGAEMTSHKALSMEVSDSGDEAEIAVVAQSAVDQTVEYEVEITGQSRAVHKGRTKLAGGSTHTLSRFKVSYAEEWCARLTVKEQAGAEYVVVAGTCEQTGPASN